jgi:large subunit ribosomal protein L30
MTEITETKVPTTTELKNTSGKLALVLVRGVVNLSQSVKDTLNLLRLNKKNYCVVIENNPVNLGMIKKVKDFITWGEIDNDTFKELVSKRGEEFQARLTDRKEKYSYKSLEIDGKKYKPYFRLNPPRKGFGRKGIKVAFKVGGGLGNRAEKINDLIRRML